KSNMPYKMIGGHMFYERKEIKDVLAYLNLIVNPSDNFSFRRIVNEPKRGIGPGTLQKLSDAADSLDWSLYETALNISITPVTGKVASALEGFALLIKNLREMSEFISVTELTEEMLTRSGYLDA